MPLNLTYSADQKLFEQYDRDIECVLKNAIWVRSFGDSMRGVSFLPDKTHVCVIANEFGAPGHKFVLVIRRDNQAGKIADFAMIQLGIQHRVFVSLKLPYDVHNVAKWDYSAQLYFNNEVYQPEKDAETKKSTEAFLAEYFTTCFGFTNDSGVTAFLMDMATTWFSWLCSVSRKVNENDIILVNLSKETKARIDYLEGNIKHLNGKMIIKHILIKYVPFANRRV